jgi:hypothetical protein
MSHSLTGCGWQWPPTRYGLTATPTGETCPETRVVTGPPVSGAWLIVPLMSLLAQ